MDDTQTTPRCPHFGTCGGCQLQHLTHDSQLDGKRKRLSDWLNTDDIHIVSDDAYGYRNRMDFVFAPGKIGLRRRGDWKTIIDIDQCPISDPRIETLLTQVRSAFRNVDAFDPIRKRGTFRYAVIRCADDTAICFTLNADSTRIRQAMERIEAFAQDFSADHIVVTTVAADTDMSMGDQAFAVKGTDQLIATYQGMTFTYPIIGFFQNNHSMANKMQHVVSGLLDKDDISNHHLIDLYGGVGTFGIINAHRARQVTIIEAVEPAIVHAQRNIAANGITNAQAIVQPAEKLEVLDLSGPMTIIADPPRSGTHPKARKWLEHSGAQRIIYISCNPKLLPKELAELPSYRMGRVTLCDLFPQTKHMEAIIELVRR